MFCSLTVNGYELNKSYVADTADYSISDVSAWFQTKVPNKTDSQSKDRNKNLADETFETKVANFRELLLKVKEIIDGKIFKIHLHCIASSFFYADSYSDNIDLARTTANLEEVVSKIIDDEEKKRKI